MINKLNKVSGTTVKYHKSLYVILNLVRRRFEWH